MQSIPNSNATPDDLEKAPEQTACNGAGIGLFTATGQEKIHSAEC
jgi:hypothetical protein